MTPPTERDAGVRWLEPYLDELSMECVRRFLAGEQAGGVDPRLPAPAVLAERARSRGDRDAAIDLAVTAVRVVTGIAWWQIGGRLGLSQTRKPVSAISVWAAPARRRFERLAAVPGATANTLAPVNEPGLTFEMVAQRLHVDGATTAPAPQPIPQPGSVEGRGESPPVARPARPSRTDARQEQHVLFRLPKSVDVARRSGQVAGLEGTVAGCELKITAPPGARYIEQILASVLLDGLETGAPAWLQQFDEARREVAADGGILKVTGPTLSLTGMTDTYYFSADLAHRLYFERRWSEGLACTWILANAGTGDLMQKGTQRRTKPNRSNLARAMSLTRGWSALGGPWSGAAALGIVNLFTLRTYDVAALAAASTSRNHARADDAIGGALRRSCAAVAAWGSGSARDEPSRPGEVRRIVGDSGIALHGMYSTYGGRRVRWLSNGQPRYTMHLSGDAQPVPLDHLLADHATPLP